jgi:uncharacterized protein
MSYRILSLDGGGAWALIEVKALIDLYGSNTTGWEVLRRFDLATANSGGSLVLGGLLKNLPLSDLLGYFKDQAKRESIFSPTSSWGDTALHTLTGMGPKYSAKAKLPALETILGDTGTAKLARVAATIPGRSGQPIHAMIVGFDYDRNRATFFRSAPAGSAVWGDGAAADVTVAEAIHASTNAPVNYFDAPADFPLHSERYWDGGITGCNNPVLVAVTEAVVLGNTLTDILALSIGTASVVRPVAPPGAPSSPYLIARADPSLVGDLRKLATSILDDPPDAASFIAHAMTGGSSSLPPGVDSRIVRMNPLISPVPMNGGGWTAPTGVTPAQFAYLCNLDMDAVKQTEVAAIEAYCDFWIAGQAPNQPIRYDGATLRPEIGYDRYPQAKSAWRTLDQSRP